MNAAFTRRPVVATCLGLLAASFGVLRAAAAAALPALPAARIPPADAIDPAVLSAFEAQLAKGRPVLNIHRVMAYAPEMSAPYGQLVLAIRNQGRLERRYRELAIMRVAHLAGSAYEWEQHAGYFLEQGFSDTQLAAVRDGPRSGFFSSAEQSVLAFVDAAMTDAGRMDDAAFSRLRGHFSDQEIVELIITTGTYRTTALIANVLQVRSERAPSGA